MRKKFIEGLDRALAAKQFKNEAELCRIAGIDKAVFNRFYSTIRYSRGEIEKPTRTKDNINLDTVSNLIDALGGMLVFPWDKDDDTIYAKARKLEEELAIAKGEILRLEGELSACEKMCSRFENIIRDKIPSYSEAQVEARQDKSCAS